MNNSIEPMAPESAAVKKKWSIPLLIITLAWLVLSLLSPFAALSMIACIIYILVTLALIFTSVIKREQYKIGLVIICNVISVVFNCLILFTHLNTPYIHRNSKMTSKRHLINALYY